MYSLIGQRTNEVLIISGLLFNFFSNQ